MQLLLIPIWILWFSFGFVYYGVVLLMLRVFEADSNGPSDTTCSFDYINIMINSSTEVVTVLMVMFMIEPVGRIKILASSFFITGVSVIFISLPMSSLALTFVAAIIRIGAVATAELLPTRLRVTGNSLATTMERLASLIAPFLVQSNSISLSVVSGVLCLINIIGIICALSLPETQGLHLDTEYI
jgi:hypothetical protein